MPGLTNQELEKLSKHLIGKNFLGVYPSDSKPRIKNTQNNSLIFNLSKHNEPGTHYVSVLFQKNKILFFDSFGKTLTNTLILNFLRTFNLPIFYVKKKIQTPDSHFCSLFSLSFLFYVQKKKKTVYQFTKMFDKTPTKNNEKIVTRLLFKE